MLVSSIKINLLVKPNWKLVEKMELKKKRDNEKWKKVGKKKIREESKIGREKFIIKKIKVRY